MDFLAPAVSKLLLTDETAIFQVVRHEARQGLAQRLQSTSSTLLLSFQSEFLSPKRSLTTLHKLAHQRSFN